MERVILQFGSKPCLDESPMKTDKIGTTLKKIGPPVFVLWAGEGGNMTSE